MKLFVSKDKAQQGNALVLSMLILMALTSVGVLAMQQTNTELMVAGNLARAVQAQSASESGLLHSMAWLTHRDGVLKNKWFFSYGQGSSAFAGGASDEAGNYCLPFAATASESKVRPILCRSSRVDPDVGDPNQSLPVADSENSLARLRQDVSFYAGGGHMQCVEVAGSDVSAMGKCVLELGAKGGLPMEAEPIQKTLCLGDDPNCKPDTVVVETRARIMLGFPCDPNKLGCQ